MGRLPFRSAVVKFISSLITIGTGGSIGREGGITQLRRPSPRSGPDCEMASYRFAAPGRLRAASGISAAYNAPIFGCGVRGAYRAGVIFYEPVRAPGLASVVATMVSRSFFGIKPCTPCRHLNSPGSPNCRGRILDFERRDARRFLAAQFGLKALSINCGPLFTFGGDRRALGFGLIAFEVSWSLGNGYVDYERDLHGDFMNNALPIAILAGLFLAKLLPRWPQ